MAIGRLLPLFWPTPCSPSGRGRDVDKSFGFGHKIIFHLAISMNVTLERHTEDGKLLVAGVALGRRCCCGVFGAGVAVAAGR